MYLILQQDEPEDFVIATGKQYSVRQFVEWSAEELGIKLKFTGTGNEEIGTVTNILGEKAPSVKVGDVVVKVDSKYYRPAEVDTLLGCALKAKEKLGWQSKISAREMCREMVNADLTESKKRILIFENMANQNKSNISNK